MIMKNERSGNGVKVAEGLSLIAEVRAIINTEVSVIDKMDALRAVKFHGRRHQNVAEAMVQKYMAPKVAFQTRSLLGQFPRGEERVHVELKPSGQIDMHRSYWKARRSWGFAFKKHICSLTHMGYWSFMPDWYEIGAFVRDRHPDFRHKGGFPAEENYRPYANEIKAWILEKWEKKREAERKVEEFCKASGLDKSYYSVKQATVADVQASKADYLSYCVVKGWYITVRQREDASWDYYSKSWHRKYGPKVTVAERWIRMSKGGKVKNVDVERFAGDYLFKAIEETLNVKPQKTAKSVRAKLGKNFKRVQLNKRYKVVKAGSRFGLDFYRLDYAGETQSYCVINSTGATFHAPSIRLCVQGLNKKRKARYKAENTILNYEIARKVACHDGIVSFCADNDLDIDKEYTVQELRNIVLKKRELNCSKYADELHALGVFINCK